MAWRFLLMAIGSCLLLNSCARAPVKPPSPPAGGVLRQDIIHRVAPGETAWRISKMYAVPIEDIVRANQLRSAEDLKMGQRLKIPGAAPSCPVVNLYPSAQWKYIVIHHSATDAGDALAFHQGHKKRGFDQGLGYHFVISNGSGEKPDGHIEMSPRWIKQQDGAHCKAGGMNHKGIGICLVGNFNHERVTEQQMESLIYLVRRLSGYYKIPPRQIIGHCQVPGAQTECPGRNFPWQEFRRRLPN
ncbi:MAG: N-acetylmuramoyl-L-alanine amidase [Candidatus Omnitrophica bacterium]|nr:N-acetylmuramoyl-L-alanine amidase [Candidatus Omnitrophota bacterium]